MTAIDDFFTHYYSRRPVNATFTGVHAYDHQLPDWSADGLAAQDDEMRALGDALAAAGDDLADELRIRVGGRRR